VVCVRLAELGGVPQRVLEPACGAGAFLIAARETFGPACELAGVEVQRERYGPALAALGARDAALQVRFADAYRFDFGALPWAGDGPLALIGNPPWIAADALVRSGALQPPRDNHKRLRGLDARTGAANFDVAEFLALKVLREAMPVGSLLALILKARVARDLIDTAARVGIGLAVLAVEPLDARRWFGAAVDAVILYARVTGFAAAPAAAPAPRGGALWRAGIKHDAAAVFELVREGEIWRNGFGEIVEVPAACRYPYRKARDLHHDSALPERALIVTQTRLGQATDGLPADLRRYLTRHAARLSARRSSIYVGAAPFAMFGVGPYSFAPWKVGVAGLYARPHFRVLGPREGKPTLVGDTAYFVSFDERAPADAFAELMNGAPMQAAIAQRVRGGKRPVTKRLLDALPA
jgi:hypothetical protein